MYASYHQQNISQARFDSPNHHCQDMYNVFNKENTYPYYTPIKPRSPLSNLCLNQENFTATGSSSSDCSRMDSKPPKKRGRKPKIPSEDQELSRRLKKQDLERKRRASISDKMTAIHKLTKQLLGEDDNTIQHTEKADILNLCHNVLKGIANVMETEPTLAERVKLEWNDCVKFHHGEQNESLRRVRKRSSNSSSTNEDSIPSATVASIQSAGIQIKAENHSTPCRRVNESNSSLSGTSASNTSPWTSRDVSSFNSSHSTTSSGVVSSNSISSNSSHLADVWRPYL